MVFQKDKQPIFYIQITHTPQNVLYAFLGCTAQQSKVAIIYQLSLNIFQPLDILTNLMYKVAHPEKKYLSVLYKFLISRLMNSLGMVKKSKIQLKIYNNRIIVKYINREFKFTTVYYTYNLTLVFKKCLLHNTAKDRSF